MNSKSFKASVIRTLDQYAKDFHFPALNSIDYYWHFGAIRLTVFRSTCNWLMAFDSIIFNLNICNFDHIWLGCGNLVDDSDPSRSGEVFRNIDEAHGCPISSEEGEFLFSKWDFSLLINKKLRRFTPSRNDYKVAGVDADDPSMPVESQILRLLVHKIADEVFLLPGPLLNLWSGADSGLAEFLVLREWNHPDVFGGEKPSDVSTFQMLAESLANNDPKLFVPDRAPNTHWSNWPML